MAMCPRCKSRFRTLPDEEGDHPCPICGWEPGLWQCDVELVDDDDESTIKKMKQRIAAQNEEVMQLRARAAELFDVPHKQYAALIDAVVELLRKTAPEPTTRVRIEVNTAGRYVVREAGRD